MEQTEDLERDIDVELDSQTKYMLETKSRLAVLTNQQSSPGSESGWPADNVRSHELPIAKLPEIKCDHFSGEDNDHLAYFDFLTKFNNAVGKRPNLSKCTKLIYLKSYLRGYALKLVQHLHIVEDNYEEALAMLKDEFLDEESLIDDLFTKILDLKPKLDAKFMGTKVYLSDVRCIISDLKNYGCDLLADTACRQFVSHIVFNRLPYDFRRELCRKVDTNYPGIGLIFDNYLPIIRSMQMKPANNMGPVTKPESRSFFSKKGFSDQAGAGRSAVKSYNVTNKPGTNEEDSIKRCKFCSATSHGMTKCSKYPDHESRKARCKTLKLCARCSSVKHSTAECQFIGKCFFCTGNNHIGALCPKFTPVTSNYCINLSHTGGTNFILPVATVKISRGGRTTCLHALLDTGAQRSYLSAKAARELNFVDTNLR